VIDWALTHQAVRSPRDMPRVLSCSFLGAITYSITNGLKTLIILVIHFGGPKSCKCCIAAILTLGDVSDIQRDYPTLKSNDGD
jgi:hypothetical protein